MRPTRRKNLSLVCPKTGKRLKRNSRSYIFVWLLPVTGLLSLIWFLVRVIPKPSRATYPCQRLAAPLASGFIAWVAGLIGSTLAYRKARRLVHQSRYSLAGIFLAIGVLAVWWPLSLNDDKSAGSAWTATDQPNSPVGVAQGIYPGRVVWIHDPNATSWNGSTGSWWDDNNTDQDVVDYMVSKAIQGLTGESDDASAWEALFRHFNQIRGFGDVSYQPGERIAVKINMNQDSGGAWSAGDGMPSPHVIYSLLDQLISAVGVPGSAITIYDASRCIGDPIYNKVRSNPDSDFQSVSFVVSPSYVRPGRSGATYNTSDQIYFAHPSIPTTYVPRCAGQAKYLINMALLRPHSMFGITLCGKNHFGSVRSGGSWSPAPLHNYGRRENSMGTYNCLVDLIGYRHLGGKTLLYMVDGLYPARNQGDDVVRYESEPFNGDWCSSIFTSQDPVAIDSVGLDFLRAEQETPNSRLTDVIGNPDNYLHEAAQANNPPSGTFYDPDHAGNVSRLPSLGVHEHWNNATDKQYSRNLGTGNGIELWRKPLAPDVDLSGDGIVNFVDYSTLVQYWLQSESMVDVAPPPDGDGIVDGKDLALLAENWLRVTTIPPLPEPAGNPYPPNGAAEVSLIADLSWSAGAGAISQDVYFGTISPGTFQRNQTNMTFDPGVMTLNTTYYWRIDQVNEWGKTTGTVWRFTTTAGPPPP